MRIFLTVLFCLVSLLALSAKKIPKNPMKWGKIPTADLQMTSYELDPTAAAIVLGNYGEIKYFAENGYIKYKYKVHKRIKILKASALKQYADFEISHSKSEQFKLERLKVQSFTVEGKKQKVKSRNKFVEKQNEYTLTTKVAIPNVQVGSVIEYRYTITSMAAKRIPSWNFQEQIPVRFSLFNLETPETMEFLYYIKGREYMTQNKDGSYTYQGISKCTVIGGKSFMMENLRAIDGEDHIATISDYWAGVSFYLKSYLDYYGDKITILEDWDDMAAELRAWESFGKMPSPPKKDSPPPISPYQKRGRNKALLEAAAPILKDTSLGQKEKLEALYDFVNENVNWNEYYSPISDDLDTAFHKKSATSGELNFMLLSLLAAAEIKAYPVLLSTRGHGKAIEISPLQGQFNHNILMVPFPGDTLFVDARNKLRPIGYPSVPALNKRGWVVRDSTNEWINLPAPHSGSIYLVNASLEADGSLSGVMKNAYEGYDAVAQRTLHQQEKTLESWQEELEGKYPEIKIDSCRFENVEKMNALFKSEFDWQIPEAAQVTGNFIYLSPSFFSAYSENFLKQNERIYPVDFPYPFKEQLVVNIKLPKGYLVDELPEPVNLVLPNRGAKFQFFAKEKNGTVQVISKLAIRQLIFQPWEYAHLKKLFDLVVEKHGEQLVLKKEM